MPRHFPPYCSHHCAWLIRSLLLVSAGVLCLVLLALPGQAGVFYVDPLGSDSADGDEAHPWKTIQNAADTLSPGDTVKIRPGIYSEAVEVNVSGSKEGGWITFEAEKGAILDGSKVRKRAFMWEMTNRSYVRLQGLEIRGLKRTDEGSGVRIEGAGSHLEITRCHIHHIQGVNAMAITVYGTNPKAAIENLVIEANLVEHCEPAPSEAVTLNGNVRWFRIENNVIRDVNNIAIDMIGGESDIVKGKDLVTREGVCRGNRVERARSSYEDGFGAGIYVDGGKDIVIEGNWITGCDLGLELGCENKGVVSSGITVRGNFIWSNDKAGIAFGGYNKTTGAVAGCEISENRLWENSVHSKSMAEIWIQKASNCVLKGNLIHGGRSGKLLLVEPLAGTNTLGPNTWFATERGISFDWRGMSHPSLEALQQGAQVEKGSQFQDPAFPDASTGKLR
jgi:hypothetical protein